MKLSDRDIDFETLLDHACANGDTDWELEFTDNMQERYDQWGDDMYLSDPQLEVLERIANV